MYFFLTGRSAFILHNRSPFFKIHRLTSTQPRDYRVVFLYIKKGNKQYARFPFVSRHILRVHFLYVENPIKRFRFRSVAHKNFCRIFDEILYESNITRQNPYNKINLPYKNFDMISFFDRFLLLTILLSADHRKLSEKLCKKKLSSNAKFGKNLKKRHRRVFLTIRRSET